MLHNFSYAPFLFDMSSLVPGGPDECFKLKILEIRTPCSVNLPQKASDYVDRKRDRHRKKHLIGMSMLMKFH